ncbi:MAG: glycogen/starch/alpha-glucan phosphorylase [Deltaproteobacteria bacterium]|nr:glycogen/starch/alpha-glucan phosphorylase [Deltaproteobacteria bacterium]
MTMQRSAPTAKIVPERTGTWAFNGAADPLSADSIRESIVRHLQFTLAELPKHVDSKWEPYVSIALAVRDRLIESWILTQEAYYNQDAKRVYYLSLEFLMGRTLGNAMLNLGVTDACGKALTDLGYTLEDLRDAEWDAGLGNGGLGRLAACFLDSLATLQLPAYGYGIRYEYGIFHQRIVNGVQVEVPDTWLEYGNPWEIPRPTDLFKVNFYGRVHQHLEPGGKLKTEWVDSEEVLAMPYDTPIPGYKNGTVNTLRLWAAKASRDFDFRHFNSGDYRGAVESKMRSENISKVLYPNDNLPEGKELRLKQEYFFVSATLQDVVRRYKKQQKLHPNVGHGLFAAFAEKNAIQLNDTHPALAIPELMRILMDLEGLGWDDAWEITQATCGYTNHTVMPEALERWTVSLMGRVLPRHLQLIYEINDRFLKAVRAQFPGDDARCRRMSIIEEGSEQRVRMANLAIVGSHSVNGVAALHSQILMEDVFPDFVELWPKKFNNKTNGITQRRWLLKSNPKLSNLITGAIGDAWITDLFHLKKLAPLATDTAFQEKWRAVKRANKERLALEIQAQYKKRGRDLVINLDSMFDCQVKRLHEYKRQLLNALHAITLYNRIKANPKATYTPRTILFAGKAAPGYHQAKLIIKLINSIGDVVNNDADVGDRLKVVFMADYRVSLAEKIFPASDLSEQISTAGTEASGTGNMKFSLNGALTIGTMDGANVEICEEVGADNIFIFGMLTEEVRALRPNYRPAQWVEQNAELHQVLEMIGNGSFSPGERDLFKPIVDSLLHHDEYMLMADFASYVACQEKVSMAYRDQKTWTKKSILNVAQMGKFSTDRTISDYARDIWNVTPVKP